MILITGATGTTGVEIVRALTSGGTKIRALVRNLQKAQSIAGPSVELIEGDFGKPETLAPALAGAEHVLLLSSPDQRQVELQGNLIEAAKRAGVQHLVKFSAIGADPKALSPFQRWHAATERQVEQSGIPYTHLRPNIFMQNFLGSAATIQSQGAIYAPIENTRVSFVDVRDIAAVAAKVLVEPGHQGKAYDITGPESLTHTEIAERFSTVLGRKISFVDVTPDAFKQGLLGAGVPEWMADAINGLYAGFARGIGAQVNNVVVEVGKKQPIRFEQFVRDHTQAFN